MAIRKIVSRSIGTDVIVAEDLAANSITVSELSDDAVTTAKIADNNITTAKLHDDATYRATFKNKLINGDMNIWQRRTSADETSVNSNPAAPVAADRWYITNQGSMWATWDWTREEDTPTGQGFKYSSKVTVGSMNSVVVSDAGVLGQRIHYTNLFDTAWGTADAKNCTVSFWVKSNKTGEFAFSLRYRSTGNLRYNKAFTINAADTWEKKTFTITAPTSVTYDFRDLADTSGVTGLEFQFWVFAGSDYTDTAIVEGWQNSSGSIHGASTQSLDTASDYFQWTGCQFEIGDSATQYEHLDYYEQLRRCQAYYYKTGAVGSAVEWFPGVATRAAYDNIFAASPYATQDRPFLLHMFPVPMVQGPAVTFYPGRPTVSNTAGNITVYNGDTSVTTTSKPSSSYGAGIYGYFQGTSTDSPMYTLQLEADAEI